jgi:Glycosyl hydrolase-like 10
MGRSEKILWVGVAWCVSLGCATGPSVWGEVGEVVAGEGEAIYVSDMGACTPSSGISRELTLSTWRTIAYESEEVSGTMLRGYSFASAPDVTLPLDVEGWYQIYIGYWNPEFSLDGDSALKVKLSGDPAFRQMMSPPRSDTQYATYLDEVYYDTADLTGRDIVFGKSSGLQARGANIAYVKLVPLSNEAIERVKADRAQKETRKLVAVLDGLSYFHYSEYTRPEHFLEQVELYRNSDVGKVLWAVNYGDWTNYPTDVQGASFLGEVGAAALYMKGEVVKGYYRGQGQMYTSLKALAKEGLIPQQIAAEHAHKLGLEFDIMFRLGISAGYLPDILDEGIYVNRYPQYRQVMRDGTVVSKASYAYPEVRQFMLSLIREAATKIDVDGINLCFNRGPHFLRYEEPVLSLFQERYGEDALEVDPTDPRLAAVRSEFMTEFVRGARQVLDEVGKAKGRRLKMSVWVWPSDQATWMGETPIQEGLDVKSWISEGLLDSLICQGGADAEYMKLCEASGTQFVLFTGYAGDLAMSPKTVAAGYLKGVDTFAAWDIDSKQIGPQTWSWLRRVGHREEMLNWEKYDLPARTIQLKSVGGMDVLKSLGQSVYSGG